MPPAHLFDRIRKSLWFVPVMCVLAGTVLSVATIWIDRANDFEIVPSSLTGGPDVAIAILSTVAASMVSLAALVLTITMVVVQLAMGQFSPRIVQTFLQDKPSQVAIGLFVATFAHSVVALREVREDEGTVPGLAIVVAFVLVLISIGVLVLYVHHIGQSLRVAALIELVGGKTRRVLDEVYPDHGDEGPLDPQVVRAPRSGVLGKIHYAELVSEARAAEARFELLVGLGEFVPAGAPLVRVEGPRTRVDERRVGRAVEIGLERSLDQDVAYGLRMLVDVAERALAESPFLDPTTAVQAIDRIHDCLRQLSRRPFPDGRHRDDQGEVRLVVPSMDWDAYVHLAFDEIRRAGAGSPQVSRRLRAALDDLLAVALPERRGALLEQVELLEASTSRVVEDEHDEVFDLRADPHGIGVVAGRDDEVPRGSS